VVVSTIQVAHGTLASLKWNSVACLTRRSLTRRSLARKRAVFPWLLFDFFVFFYCSSKYTPGSAGGGCVVATADYWIDGRE
jgi:hypothetical protein